jgi:CRISPR/Cas system CSM-associated protein Csm3 (group 7 of RAMP superfamily)
LFEKLESRYRFLGELLAKTPVHIGSGKEETWGVDMPILLSPEEEPYIPGSSLKGVVRSCAERTLRSVAAPHVDGEKEPCAMCLAARVFGSQSQASKVLFRDCPSKGSSRDYRFGIGIDRKTKTVADGALFSIEFVPTGARFQVEILADNLADEELGILCVGLNPLVEGHASLGGGKSRGLGAVKLDFTKIEKISPIHYLYSDPSIGVEDKNWEALKRAGLEALRKKLGI